MSLRKIVLSASSGNGCKSDKTLFGARTQEVGRKTANLMLGLLLTSTIGLAQFTGTVWENTPDASNASDPANMASTLPSAQFVSSAIYFCSVPGGEPGCPATAGYNVGAFLNNPTFTNLQNGFTAGNNLDNTEVQLTGSIYLTAGDNNFMIGHDDGFTMQISGGQVPSRAPRNPALCASMYLGQAVLPQRLSRSLPASREFMISL